jgi:DNA-binding IscR family transcriptional regulator
VQTPATRALQSVWNEVADTQRAMLESTTFADLAERLRQPAEEMWHI